MRPPRFQLGKPNNFGQPEEAPIVSEKKKNEERILWDRSQVLKKEASILSLLKSVLVLK